MTGKKMKVLTCPQCGGYNVYYEAGMTTGAKYHCQDCDYLGALVVEKDISVIDTKPVHDE